jgi:hypothetical protein
MTSLRIGGRRQGGVVALAGKAARKTPKCSASEVVFEREAGLSQEWFCHTIFAVTKFATADRVLGRAARENGNGESQGYAR